MKTCMRAFRALALLFCASCAETGQSVLELPLYVAGSAPEASARTRDGTRYSLDAAELAFGPLYLCAGTQAGGLCETARLEWTSSEVVDLLDAAPRRAGELRGVSGPVRSYMYDLGITSLLTREEPLVLPAADDLGGNSVRIAGSAVVDDVTLPFVIELALSQQIETEVGVPIVRKSAGERFDHEASEETRGVLVRFDASEWLREVDFRALAEAEGCLPDGCKEPLRFAAGSQAYLALRNAIVSGERPELVWDFDAGGQP